MKKETIFWVLLCVGAILFSSALMWQTFSYDKTTGSVLIAPKAWSDFAAHIPLIRSFSLGNNWPPESPLYPGSPIRYHFLFYFLVGSLEKYGVRIDWALNSLSIIGLAGLMILIALITQTLFHRRSISMLAVFLFCFNGSLSFLRFFEKHPLAIHTLRDIVTNTAFPAFGPWDGGLVSAFWTMNLYTNQRHLALSYALVLAGMLLVFTKRTRPLHTFCQSFGVALIMSILLFLNQAAALIAGVWFLWIFIIKKESRIPLFLASWLTLPSIVLYTRIVGSYGPITFDPGYLVRLPRTVSTIFLFWWQNLGLSLLMIPFGFLVAPKKIKVLFVIPMLLLFIVPNLWRFSPDMINNHKFFNFFLVMGNMLTAYAVITIVDEIKKISRRVIRTLAYGGVGLLVCLLTFSGIIDLFPIFNESRMPLPDMTANTDVVFFRDHTNPSDTILNSTWFYNPASLAGRKIFSGYTYFTWSYGYDQETRERIQEQIFAAQTKKEACTLLKANSIDDIELSDTPEHFLIINRPLFTESFHEVYRNDLSGISVYDVASSCL